MLVKGAPSHYTWTDDEYLSITPPRKQFWIKRQFEMIPSKISSANIMMTSSNGNIFRVTGPLCGEFTGPGEFPLQRPVTRSFDVFFDLRLNKRLSKQPWGWWFETLSWSLWRQCNVSTNLLRSNLMLLTHLPLVPHICVSELGYL